MKRDRRDFLKGVTLATAASATALTGCATEDKPPKVDTPVSPPSNEQRADETGESIIDEPEYSPEEEEEYFVKNPVSDYMVDVIKSVGIEYIAINAGSSFRGLQESLVNYGGNTQPEILTCLHEESAVAIAHGYAKAKGKPMAVLCHGTVGTQHAAMAIYNAYCDRA